MLLIREPYDEVRDSPLSQAYSADSEDLPCGGATGSPHSIGGGFVADTATVRSSAYIGPKAQVCDEAEVSWNVRIFMGMQRFLRMHWFLGMHGFLGMHMFLRPGGSFGNKKVF